MTLNLTLLPETYAICRLAPEAGLPYWVVSSGFLSITRTEDELSIVCEEHMVPPGTKTQPGWACLKVIGPLDFSLTGVLASLAAPLAAAGISIFVVSTFETDYLLVKRETLDKAINVLTKASFIITQD